MKNYQITGDFKGFRTKEDATKLADGFFIEGSQNIISTDGGTVKLSNGKKVLGAENTALTPIESSTVWLTKRGLEIPLRSYDDELEIYFEGAWERLKDSWSSVAFCFPDADGTATGWWDATQVQDLLLFVNGDSNIYSWGGGIARFKECTANTITKTGTTTWAEEGFLTGTKKIMIDGTEYQYTGGETTTTLTGVTPDPTGAAYAVDTLVVQSVETSSNKPASSVKQFTNDIISIVNNQVYIGSNINRSVYVSKSTDFDDFAFSSPRLPGEGALFILDGTVSGMVAQEEAMYISTNNGQWYQTYFQVSSDNAKEILSVKLLRSGNAQGAYNQGAITKAKNSIIFLSQEPTIDEFGRIENINTPQSVPLSDGISRTLESYDLTNAHFKYYRDNLYCAIPEEEIVLIYNFEKGYWETPQTFAISRIEVIDGVLVGHSSVQPESYTLFSEEQISSIPIDAKARFSYQNYGDRVNLKTMDEWFTEGYIKKNTTITCTLRYDYGGYTTTKTFDIVGSDDDIIFTTDSSNTLGKVPLGSTPLGTGSTSLPDVFKFRHIKQLKPDNFFELSVEYSSNDADYYWEILSMGGNVRASGQEPIRIKK